MDIDPLVKQMDDRLAFDKEEGDIAYFYALLIQLEYVTKLVVSGVVACLGEDANRSRYSLEYRLVRTDSIGNWVSSLNSALTGPAAQFFIPSTTHITRDLTERVQEGDWRFEVVSQIAAVAQHFGLDSKIGNRVALRQFFEIAATIRNRTRGHGAATSNDCSEVCPTLERAIKTLLTNHALFKSDWAHIHRNLSGKYRVSPLLGDCADFEYLKTAKDVNLANGVYISIEGFLQVPFVRTNPGISDIYLPNGNFRANEYETLSFFTNKISRENGSPWSVPPGRLPASHTEGHNVLDQVGNVFTNLPAPPSGHISRERLERTLADELLNVERHPIIALTGPGGIGKTTLTLAVVDALAKSTDCPYEVILWMSSRDVDLLDTGPKPVNPKVVTKGAIAKAAADLLEPRRRNEKTFDVVIYFEECLRSGAAGNTLFILDNFETVESPADVFQWIDTHIRHPNKVLITTRFRDFHGDYPLEIAGMSESEAMLLIDQEAKRLGITDLVSFEYARTLADEADGHPYVIKILLGQVAKEKCAVKPERIIAGADQLLTALFERTYEGLSPAGKRIFLLLSSWRVFVPTIAVEAVSLRPGNERFNVIGAIDELRRFSFIEEVVSETEDETFVGVPLAAASFGRRKIVASPFKVAVEKDRELLMEFGAGKRESARQGVMPRIDRLVGVAASRASENPAALEDFLPILEYLASRVPQAYLSIATLLTESDLATVDPELVKGYLRRYLEVANNGDKEQVWFWLADLCHSSDDAVGEVHSLSEVAMLPTATAETMGVVANRINIKLRDLRGRGVSESWSDEVRQLIERVAEQMSRHLVELDATACSRLAWLFLNMGNSDRARDIAKVGLQIEPENEHCSRLLQRLER